MLYSAHPDDEPVPTSLELVKMGAKYAVVVEWSGATKTKPGKPSKIRIMEEGHRLLGDTMRRNALAAIERAETAGKQDGKREPFVEEAPPWGLDPWASNPAQPKKEESNHD